MEYVLKISLVCLKALDVGHSFEYSFNLLFIYKQHKQIKNPQPQLIL